MTLRGIGGKGPKVVQDAILAFTFLITKGETERITILAGVYLDPTFPADITLGQIAFYKLGFESLTNGYIRLRTLKGQLVIRLVDPIVNFTLEDTIYATTIEPDQV